jgi:protein KTI12
VFENLIFRYEEPNAMTRWDSPLFTVLFDDEDPQCESVWEAVLGSDGNKKTAKPNLATVLKPATQQDYLHELDRGTSEIVARILEWQKDHMGESGGNVNVEGVEAAVELPTNALTLAQLQRMRRHFITLNRQHSLEKARIRTLFVDFLNDSFNS